MYLWHQLYCRTSAPQRLTVPVKQKSGVQIPVPQNATCLKHVWTFLFCTVGYMFYLTLLLFAIFELLLSFQLQWYELMLLYVGWRNSCLYLRQRAQLSDCVIHPLYKLLFRCCKYFIVTWRALLGLRHLDCNQLILYLIAFSALTVGWASGRASGLWKND